MNSYIHKPKQILFILFLLTPISSLLLHVLVVTSSKERCPETTCGNYSSSQQTIRLPFCITTSSNSQSNESPCLQYPSYNVYCDDKHRQSLLQLPNDSGNFSIKTIDFTQQRILLTDPSDCLAKRIASLDISLSPFHWTKRYRLLRLYNCTRLDYENYLSSYEEISCLSRDSDNYAVVFTWDGDFLPSNSATCQEISEVNVPVDGTNDLSNDFPTSIPLAWDMPGDCRNYDPSDSMWCDQQDDGSFKLACQDGRKSKSIIGIVMTVISSVLGLAVAISFSCWYYCGRTTTTRSPTTTPQTDRIQMATNNNPQQQPQPPVLIVGGLDQAIIDTYPSIVIGDSGRLINPDDNICSICLVEYCPEDTLKILPLCLHRFHKDCIDQWLRAKVTCPVCRTPPPWVRTTPLS